MLRHKYSYIISILNHSTNLYRKHPLKLVAPLSDQEVTHLKTTYQESPHHHLRVRAKAILLSHQGYSLTAIGKCLNKHYSTISIWVKNWAEHGWDGLYNKPRSGRTRIYNSEEQERIKELVDQWPNQLKKVQAILAKETGKSACLKTLQRILKKI